MQRLLGIDYGTRRIGLAIGDDTLRIASPIETVAADGMTPDHVRAVLKRAAKYEIDAFVVGLPLNMDGTEGQQARTTRAFGESLRKASDKPVHYFDERLSSSAAESLLEFANLTRKKHKTRVDAVAAQVILQGYLDSSADPEMVPD